MLGFLIAALAGFLTPKLEEPAARPLAKSLSSSVKVEPGEIRTLAFMLALLGAALLSTALDSDNAFAVVLGGVLGYFGTRIVAALRRAMDPPKK
ncbi:hypothetical protein [Histidinibacterium lentulum]|uniref:Uncharacterized protein n=1 Tax=Histidinibacterium lentulum TaxID=2480588 RepID=A0A3N2QTP6_9RHOB|nr:hypothetical protein [Histidinibacterium lentulum]ROT98584.1 hypothetical protein EAT49_16740 [Histidinibacterium lentulum]